MPKGGNNDKKKKAQEEEDAKHKTQLEFLEYISSQPVVDIRQAIRQKKITERKGYRLRGLQLEKIILKGERDLIHRVFVEGLEFPDYRDIGWVLPVDVEHCLSCTKEFGWFNTEPTRVRCWACGNIFCSRCCTCTKEIEELPGAGPKPVCNQCYWGQLEVRILATYVRGEHEIDEPINIEGALDDDDYDSEAEQEEGEEEEDPDHVPNTELSAEETANAFFVEEQVRLDAVMRLVTKIPIKTKVPQDVDSQSNAGTDLEIKFTYATPMPSFVIKTWLVEDKSKIFVNVCIHELLPYRPEERGSSGAEKEIYCICGQVRLVQGVAGGNKEDGKEYRVVDVLVNPREVDAVDHDGTGFSRERLCGRVLNLVKSIHDLSLEPSYKILRVSGNYYPTGGFPVSLPVPEKAMFFDVEDGNEAASAAINFMNGKMPTRKARGPSRPTPKIPKGKAIDDAQELQVIADVDFSPVEVKEDPRLGPEQVKFMLLPRPGFVMTSVNSDGLKVYINVCHHESIPRRSDPEDSESDFCYVTLSSNVVQQGRGKGVKSMEQFLVLFVVLNTSEYLDMKPRRSAGPKVPIVDEKFCLYVLSVINDQLENPIASEYLRYPSMPGGFKSRESQKEMPLIHVSLPSEAFILPDVFDVLFLPPNASDENIRVAVTPYRASRDHDTPVGESAEFFSVLQLLIKPETGFVIQVKDTEGSVFYINVCHHAFVGRIDNKCSGGKAGGSSLLGTSIVLGSLGEKMVQEKESGEEAQARVLDVAVGRDKYLATLSDPSGGIRDELAVEVLSFVVSCGVDLDSDYHLPFVEGGYVAPQTVLGSTLGLPSGSGPLFTLNLQILEDNIATVCGQLYRKERKGGKWTKYDAQLRGRQLSLFRTTDGNFDSGMDVRGSVIVLSNTSRSLNAVGDAPQFTFTTNRVGHNDADAVTFGTTSDVQRNEWIQLIDTTSRLFGFSQAYTRNPKPLRGHLKRHKKALLKSAWKQYFWVLDMGVLKRFNQAGVTGEGVSLEKQYILAGANLKRVAPDRIQITEKGNREHLLVEADTHHIGDQWWTALVKHGRFADENNNFGNESMDF